MSPNKLQMLKRLSAMVFIISLSGCVVYSQSTSPSRISSTNSAIVLAPEPAQGRDVHNVNGRVVIGAGMNANDVSTVNGRVTVENGATARSVHTVNGRVVLGGSETVVGSVDTVNGRIIATQGGEIGGTASTVNGRIELANVSVGRNVETNNGSINLFDVTVGENVESNRGDVRLENSIVERDLIIHHRNYGLLGLFNWRINHPEIIIGPGSQIKGSLIAREEIHLYVHETASVNNIIGADPVVYRGSRP